MLAAVPSHDVATRPMFAAGVRELDDHRLTG
jgi:hypothetical protein